MALLFEDAAKAKSAIMASQQKEIANLYNDWANDVADMAKFYSHKTTASAPLSERYYKELYKQMKATSQSVSDEVAGIIKSNMYTIADSVVADNVKWLQSFGFSPDGLNAAFSHVPNDVVQMLVTGQVYQSGWSLSERIWSDNQQTQKDIYQIMARGLAENKPIYNIAKDLESYVRPGAKKAWNPILATKNTKTGKIEYKRIYKKQVDYNAQRLARTLAQHTYQQSFIATTKDNPFIMEYIWHSNGSRVCELCKARDGMHFKKDELPMDHPNGMCIMEPAVAKDMVNKLADWFNSPDGTYPEIDAFADNFGYTAGTTNVKGNQNSIFGIDLNVAHLDAFSKRFQDILPEWADRVKESNVPGFMELFDFYKNAETEADKTLVEFMNDLSSMVLSYKDISVQQKEAYANIFSVMAKPHETTLYRGESGSGVNRFGGFEKGKVIKFDSFGFTSPSSKTPSAHTGVMFEFLPGTPSINFPGQDEVDDDELILGNFEIMDIIEQKNGVPRVVLKFVK